MPLPVRGERYPNTPYAEHFILAFTAMMALPFGYHLISALVRHFAQSG